eukprot:49567-Eustigmatos_ZCMA.PRE.1
MALGLGWIKSITCSASGRPARCVSLKVATYHSKAWRVVTARLGGLLGVWAADSHREPQATDNGTRPGSSAHVGPQAFLLVRVAYGRYMQQTW